MGFHEQARQIGGFRANATLDGEMGCVAGVGSARSVSGRLLGPWTVPSGFVRRVYPH